MKLAYGMDFRPARPPNVGLAGAYAGAPKQALVIYLLMQDFYLGKKNSIFRPDGINEHFDLVPAGGCPALW